VKSRVRLPGDIIFRLRLHQVSTETKFILTLPTERCFVLEPHTEDRICFSPPKKMRVLCKHPQKSEKGLGLPIYEIKSLKKISFFFLYSANSIIGAHVSSDRSTSCVGNQLGMNTLESYLHSTHLICQLQCFSRGWMSSS